MRFKRGRLAVEPWFMEERDNNPTFTQFKIRCFLCLQLNNTLNTSSHSKIPHLTKHTLAAVASLVCLYFFDLL